MVWNGETAENLTNIFNIKKVVYFFKLTVCNFSIGARYGKMVGKIFYTLMPACCRYVETKLLDGIS